MDEIKIYCKGCDELKSIFKELISLGAPVFDKILKVVDLKGFDSRVFGYPSVNWGNVIGYAQSESIYIEKGYKQVTPEEFKRILSPDKQLSSNILNKKCICCRGSEKLHEVFKRINNYDSNIIPPRVLKISNNPQLMFGYGYGRILYTEDLNYYQNELLCQEVTPEQFEKAWIPQETTIQYSIRGSEDLPNKIDELENTYCFHRKLAGDSKLMFYSFKFENGRFIFDQVRISKNSEKIVDITTFIDYWKQILPVRIDSSEQSSIKQNNVSSKKSKSISIENFGKLSLAIKKPLKIIL